MMQYMYPVHTCSVLIRRAQCYGGYPGKYCLPAGPDIDGSSTCNIHPPPRHRLWDSEGRFAPPLSPFILPRPAPAPPPPLDMEVTTSQPGWTLHHPLHLSTSRSADSFPVGVPPAHILPVTGRANPGASSAISSCFHPLKVVMVPPVVERGPSTSRPMLRSKGQDMDCTL